MSRGRDDVAAPDDDAQWRGTTAEQRAAERRSRLLATGFELLAGEGAGGVTVRAVVRSSGLSPRFFYESFADREALLLAVFEQQYELVAGHVADAVAAADDDLVARMRAALVATASWFSQRPARAEVMLHQTLAEPVLRDHARRRLPELVETTLGLAVGAETLAALPPPAVELAVVALAGAILNLFLEWTAGRLVVSAEDLAEAVVQVTAATIARLLG